MQSTRRTRVLLLALTGSLALAACDSHDYGDSPNNPTDGKSTTLSALVNKLIVTMTTDTAIPVEINALNIDTSSEDPADPNYTAILGT